MTMRIKNKLKQLLVINLNANESIHLEPEGTSKAISEKKVSESSEVQRLLKRGAVSLEVVKEIIKKKVREAKGTKRKGKQGKSR